jgi:hypothetical protein
VWPLCVCLGWRRPCGACVALSWWECAGVCAQAVVEDRVSLCDLVETSVTVGHGMFGKYGDLGYVGLQVVRRCVRWCWLLGGESVCTLGSHSMSADVAAATWAQVQRRQQPQDHREWDGVSAWRLHAPASQPRREGGCGVGGGMWVCGGGGEGAWCVPL